MGLDEGRTLPVDHRRFIVYSNARVSPETLSDPALGIEGSAVSMWDDLEAARTDCLDARKLPVFARAYFRVYDRDERQVVFES